MTKENQTAAETDERESSVEQGAAEKHTRVSPPDSAFVSEAGDESAEGASERTDGSDVPADTQQPPEETKSPEELHQLLGDARAKADEHWNALLRVQAELENLRERSAREVENAHKYGLDRFVSELLPVKDSLELGEAAAEDGTVEVGNVREGIQLTLKMFRTAFEKFGIEEVDPQGRKFDPEFHEAMSVQEVENAESGTVVTVVQKGYVLNGRLVRPAMVIVAK